MVAPVFLDRRNINPIQSPLMVYTYHQPFESCYIDPHPHYVATSILMFHYVSHCFYIWYINMSHWMFHITCYRVDKIIIFKVSFTLNHHWFTGEMPHFRESTRGQGPSPARGEKVGLPGRVSWDTRAESRWKLGESTEVSTWFET